MIETGFHDLLALYSAYTAPAHSGLAHSESESPIVKHEAKKDDEGIENERSSDSHVVRRRSSSFSGDDPCNLVQRSGFGALILYTLHSILSLSGCSSYFRFKDAPLFPLIKRGISTKGYSWTCWVSLESIRDSTSNLFSFLTEYGAGVQTYVQGNCIMARSLPAGLDLLKVPVISLSEHHWYNITVVHVPEKRGDDTFKVYLNGHLQRKETVHAGGSSGSKSTIVDSKLTLPYPPPSSSTVLQCTVGGFHGNMGQLVFLDDVLSDDQAVHIYMNGPNYIPKQHQFYAGPAATYEALAPQPQPPQTAQMSNDQRKLSKSLHAHSRFHSHLLLALFPHDSPEDDVLLVGGWSDGFEDSKPPSPSRSSRLERSDSVHIEIHGQGDCPNSHIVKLQGVKTVLLPNPRQAVHSIGGLKLLLQTCSPAFGGRKFANGDEAAAFFRIVTELITDSLENQNDIFDVGFRSIRHLVLDHLEPHMRTVVLVAAIESFLRKINAIDKSLHKGHFETAFKFLLFDFTYWMQAAPSVQRRVVEGMEWFMVKIPRWFARFAAKSLGVQAILDSIRIVSPNDFYAPGTRMSETSQSHPPRSTPTKAMGVITRLLKCVFVLSQTSKLPLVEMETFVSLIEDCKNSLLIAELLNVMVRLGEQMPTRVYGYLTSEYGDYRIFVKLLNSDKEEVRLLALRVLGEYLNARVYAEKDGPQIRKFRRIIGSAVGRNLSVFRFTPRTYSALMQVMTGRIKADIESKVELDENLLIVNPSFIRVILDGASNPECDVMLREKALLELLTMLKIGVNDNNLKQFSKSFFWQQAICGFFAPTPRPAPRDSPAHSPRSPSEFNTIQNQLVLNIAQLTLWRCIMFHETGYVAFDEFLWCMSQIRDGFGRPGQVSFVDGFDYLRDVEAELFVLVLKRVFRERNESRAKKKLFKVNLLHTLQLAEKSLFHAPESFLTPLEKFNIKNATIRDEVSEEKSTSGIIAGSSSDEIAADPLPSEIELLSMMFEAQMTFFSVQEARQDILRVLLRYLAYILPHDKCTSLFTVIVNAVEILLLSKITEKSDKNFRVVGLCIVLLKEAMERFLRRNEEGDESKAEEVKLLIHKLHVKWGNKAFGHVASDTSSSAPMKPEDTLFLLYQSDLNSIEVKKIFMMHQKRFDEVLQERAASMAAVIERQQANVSLAEAERDREFNKGMEAPEKATLKRQTKENERLHKLNVRLTMQQRGLSAEQEEAFLLRNHLREFQYEYRSLSADWVLSRDQENSDLFYKLDKTEIPENRQRILIRRDYHGTSHPEASAGGSNSASPSNTPDTMDVMALGAVKIKSSTATGDGDSSTSTSTEETKSESAATSVLGTEIGGNDIVVDDDFDRSQSYDNGEVLETSEECMLVTPMRKFTGVFQITTKMVIYIGEEIDELNSWEQETKDASSDQQVDEKVRAKELRFRFEDISDVFPRRYLLRESALEIFHKKSKVYFFNFSTGRDKYLKLMCKRLEKDHKLPAMRYLQSKTNLTKLWQNGQLSNFDYLMSLNTISGRSYNDITQYPVFPWVLTDYSSASLDLNDPSIYRDLSKPIGALNDDRWEIFEDRFESFQDEHIPAFHYGSHYSSAGIALHYLLRLEPFTTMAIKLQGGRFDLPDRLFTSVAGAWNLSYTNVSDVKELIPEFYYMPEFLTNMNRLNLGRKQGNKEEVGDVALPPWANGSPHEFVRIHRAALESDYVSAHLHEWIDLIFGFKQQGEEAIKAKNLFFYLTYAGQVDIDSIEDPALREATEAQIAHFGQTPEQLFTLPHPKKNVGPGYTRPKIELPLPASTAISSTTGAADGAEEAGSDEHALGCWLVYNSEVNERRFMNLVEKCEDATEEKTDSVDNMKQQIRVFQLMRSSPAQSLRFTTNGYIIVCTSTLIMQRHYLAKFLASPPESSYAITQMKKQQGSNSNLGQSAGGTGDANEAANPTLTISGAQKLRRSQSYRNISPLVVSNDPTEVACTHRISVDSVMTRHAVPKSAASVVSYFGCSEVTADGKFIFSGGHTDCSLKCHLVEKSGVQTLSSVIAHAAPISCIHIQGELLITGATDGSVMLWNPTIRRHSRASPPLLNKPTPLNELRIHKGPVIRVIVCHESRVALSLARSSHKLGAHGSEAVLYSIRRRRYIRTISFAPNFEVEHAAISSSLIVFYGLEDGVPHLLLCSINGTLLKKVQLRELLSVLVVNPYGEFLFTGGELGVVTVRSVHDLAEVHRFYPFNEEVVFEEEIKALMEERRGSSLEVADGSLPSEAATVPTHRSLPIGMITAIDIEPNEQHIAVAHHSGEVLVYELPNKMAMSTLGYYADMAGKAASQLKDTLYDTYDETKEIAKTTISKARDTISDAPGSIASGVTKAKSRYVLRKGFLYSF